MSNIVKYPGGKERELDIIRSYLPPIIGAYYEPFVGGGSVYLNMTAGHYFINDRSDDLINLYRMIQEQNRSFFKLLSKVNDAWKRIENWHINGELKTIYAKLKSDSSDGAAFHLETRINDCVEHSSENQLEMLSMLKGLHFGFYNYFFDELKQIAFKKLLRMKELEETKKKLSEEDIIKNVIGCSKAAFYMYMREFYNHSETMSDAMRAVLYLFMRDMCYSSMFRFNADGEFNVPYGGISYNSKHYDATLKFYKSESLIARVTRTTICCQDWKDFLETYKPLKNDFMFVDPPYDTDFSTYDNNSFSKEAQKSLANYLIDECECNWMVDIKATDYIRSLYVDGTMGKSGRIVHVNEFAKKYSVSFMNRNNREAEHLLITNYE